MWFKGSKNYLSRGLNSCDIAPLKSVSMGLTVSRQKGQTFYRQPPKKGKFYR